VAWKFRQERVADGDVVEPSEFRINTNEFVSELNGFLDADNVKRQSIGNGNIKRNTFTELIGPDQENHGRGESMFIFNHQRGVGWQDTALMTPDRNFLVPTEMDTLPQHADSSLVNAAEVKGREIEANGFKNLPRVKFSSDQDGLAIVEFCGSVSWSKWHYNYSSFPDQDVHNFLDSEGPTIGSLASDDLLHPRAYQAFMKQTKNFKVKGMYILCSQWRLTLNGMSVAESGPLGNEYQSHPIYLCGTAPVLKGRENVAKIEGRFFWYSPGDDISIEASGWSPPVKGIPTLEDFTGDTYRRDCLLYSVNMLVTYRKR